MNLWLLWILRMGVWSFPLYGVSMSFTASRRQSCHLSRNASAAGFPSGQSEFLRPGSLLWPHPPWRPCLYSNSIITSHICRQLFYSCCYLAFNIFFLINLSQYICLQQCPNAGTNFLSSIRWRCQSWIDSFWLAYFLINTGLELVFVTIFWK